MSANGLELGAFRHLEASFRVALQWVCEWAHRDYLYWGGCPENLLIKKDSVQSWLVFGCVCGGELTFWGSPKAPKVSGLKQQALLISLSILTLRGQKSRCQQRHLHIPCRLLGNLCPQHSWFLAPRPPSVSFTCDSASVLMGLPGYFCGCHPYQRMSLPGTLI